MMRKIIPLLLLLTIIAKNIPFAQEVGHLAMEVEIVTTVGGTFAGLGAGFLVWLMDPGQPTPLAVHLQGGASFGTFVGMVGGAFLLTNSAIIPQYASTPSKSPAVSSHHSLPLVYAPESYWDNHLVTIPQSWNLSLFRYHF